MLFNEKTYLKLIHWRESHIKERQFVVLLSLVVGIMSALAAVLLKSLIHGIEHLLSLTFGGNSGVNYWYLITPIIGITLAMLFVRLTLK